MRKVATLAVAVFVTSVGISVPPTWTVVTAHGCPNHAAQGILALGAPTRLTNCPVGVANVVVAALTPGDARARAGCPAIRVNGRDAYVLPCRTAGAKDIVQYLVPALGVQAVGSGTAGQNVSGPGETTIVGRVLHTLR